MPSPYLHVSGREAPRWRRLLGVVVALVLAGGVVVGPRPGAVDAAAITYSGAGGAARISVIGDSVMAAVRWYGTWEPLRRFNYTVDLESCRRTLVPSCRGRERFTPDTTVNAMRRLRGQLGSVLVIGTGYDDPGATFPGAVDAVMAEAAAQGIPVVIWATMRTAGVSYVGPTYAANAATYLSNNRVLYAKAGQYGGRLQVADWATYSARRPEWVARDGIHLTPTGSTAMAGFIADQAARALQRISSPAHLTAARAPTGAMGSGQVLLTWTRPQYSAGRVVTDYAVQYSVDGGATWQTLADGVSRKRWYVASGLTNGRVYRFRVAAWTAAGWGPYSAVVTVVPRVAKPSSPAAVTALVAPSGGMGSGQVLLSWSRPTYTSGRVVTDYIIQRSADGGATWQTFYDGVSRTTAYVASGLTNGRVYRFRVAAYTSAGWSPYSAVVTATPRVAKPSAPTGVAALVAPADGIGAGQVLLTWSPPAYSGGRTVTDYAIEQSADGGATWSASADAVTARRWHLVSGLTDGQTYRFRVAAHTSAGWSPYGAAVAATPSAPVVMAAALLAPPPPDEPAASAAPVDSSPPSVAVGDLVWVDGDGDGVQDQGEPGLAGVVVRLVDPAGAVVDEEVSDAGGRYSLVAAATAPLVLEVVLPAGYAPTLVDAGSDGTADSDADALAVVVGPVETTVRVDLSALGPSESDPAFDVDVGLVAVAPEVPADTTADSTAATEPAVTEPAVTEPAVTEPAVTEPPDSAPAPESSAPPAVVPPTSVLAGATSTTSAPSSTPPPATEPWPTDPPPPTTEPASP